MVLVLRIVLVFAVLIAVRAFGLVGLVVVAAIAGAVELARKRKTPPL